MLHAEEWPEPKATLHVHVIKHVETETHSIDYTTDGMLSISSADSSVFPDAPEYEYVKRAALIPGYIALNQAGVAALREVLKSIELQAS